MNCSVSHVTICSSFLGFIFLAFVFFIMKQVQKDETVPDLLVMPPGSDLHAHHLVKNGRIFLQVNITL